ncbi:osteomodulin [Vombatus ursinus]|uniref:Osteomodulin n=1 Tax=Vombatus ursinus TaxID=29139 RepID=A0A4X2LP20_VOMUR|nr:osteomodulin [Vombatus ursinus]XP_027691697.1 osteomodulin [Vombatus ursinus]XP_027691698.1 osteomodulin [Vombatus ursinus]
MNLLRQLAIVFFFFEVTVYCQYEMHRLGEDYDEESDDDYSPPFYFHPTGEDGIPSRHGPLGCAQECFCPLTFPLAMYCDNRKLEAIPKIPAHVQQLYLQFNEIEAVTAHSFANASNLKEINLGHNRIKSHKIEHGVFAQLPNLLQLHLDHNDLEDFPFPLPNSLERLLLGNNAISRVEAHAMEGLINLTMLDLCHNQLHDSSLKEQLSQMSKLMQLNLCSNRLESMPPDLPSSLMHLSLENNSISFIPDNYFKKFPKLLALRISYNNLQEIPYDTFNISSLVELNVGHNKLKQSFYIPRNLEHLYMEDNEFEYINVTLMCPSIDPIHYRHLTYIRLDQNRLKEPISSYIFFCFPYIHSVYYGEQRKPDGQMVQLKTQVFRRFQVDDDEEEEEGGDGEEHEPEGQEQGRTEENFDPYFY